MGNYSLLEARKHLVKLLLDTTSVRQSEDIHAIVHAIETLVSCEHTQIAVDAFRPPTTDFPSEIDFD